MKNLIDFMAQQYDQPIFCDEHGCVLDMDGFCFMCDMEPDELAMMAYILIIEHGTWSNYTFDGGLWVQPLHA